MPRKTGINSGFSALVFVLIIDRALSYAPLFGCKDPLYTTTATFLLMLILACLYNCAAKHRESLAVKITLPFLSLTAALLASIAVAAFVDSVTQFGMPYSGTAFSFFAPVIIVVAAIYFVFSGQTTVYRTGLLVLPIPIAITTLIIAAPFCNSMPLSVNLTGTTDFASDSVKAVCASLVMGFDLFAVYLAAPKQTFNAERGKFKGVCGIAWGSVVSLAATVCANRFFYGSPTPVSSPFVKMLDTAYDTQFGAFLLAFEVMALILRMSVYFLLCKKTFEMLKKRAGPLKRQFSQNTDVKM